MITPIAAPAASDVFKVDTLYSPPCKITRCNGRQLTWQEQQAPGLTGAFVVFRGEKLVQVTYRIELWDDAGFQTYAALAAYLIAAKNARPPKGFKLYDLRLADLKIPQMAVAKIPHQELVEPGRWAYEVELQEYRRLQLFGGPVEAPQNPRQQLIQQLSNQIPQLQNELAAAQAAARAGK